jgi:hypothetical protein
MPQTTPYYARPALRVSSYFQVLALFKSFQRKVQPTLIIQELQIIKYIKATIDILYAAPQAHKIVNVALHQEYSPGIVNIFSQGRKDLYHV